MSTIEKTQMLTRVHHINFLVKDLEQAVARYEDVLGVVLTERDELPDRGVKIARVRLGETWIILVQPTDAQGIPAKHLERYGEGFFLISYQVEDVLAAGTKVTAAGVAPVNSEPRQGLDDWLVLDLPADDLLGVSTQLVQSAD
jgi:methylmalonyl-CoA/ethylmalonyl-CoA epimerase